MSIYCFTNIHGSKNYGLVLEQLDGGANVLMDAFKPNDRSELPARYAYVSLTPNKYLTAEVQREILPIDTPVQWQTKELAEIHRQMKAEKFCWEDNRSRIIQQYIK